MTYRFACAIILLLLNLLLAACGETAVDDVSDRTATSGAPVSVTDAGSSATSGSSTDQSEGAEIADPGLNLLVLTEGDVELKRRVWSNYSIAPFGTELQRGDLLRLGNEGRALVLCDGLTTWEVPAGTPAGLHNGCPPPAEPLLVRGASLVGNTRGGSDPLIPFIISPRKTSLLTDRPLLRWNSVPETAEYRVTVRGPGVDWSATTSDTSIEYPGVPPLQPGQTYALLVETDSGVSSADERVPGLGFTMLDEAMAAKADETIGKIQSLDLAPEAEAVALSQYLAGQNLIAEAIFRLEEIVAHGGDAPAVRRTLGDLYRTTGLNLVALEAYENAILTADEQDALEVSAQSKEGLAEVYVTLGDREQAVRYLAEAIEGFEALGDTDQVTRIGERLAAVTGG